MLMKDCTCFLQVAAGISLIALLCYELACIHQWYKSLQKVNFFLFLLQFVIIKCNVAFPSSFKQSCKGLIVVSVVVLSSYYHDVISNHNHVFNMPKALM